MLKWIKALFADAIAHQLAAILWLTSQKHKTTFLGRECCWNWRATAVRTGLTRPLVVKQFYSYHLACFHPLCYRGRITQQTGRLR